MAEGLLKKMLSEKGVKEYSKYKIISAGTHAYEGFPPVHMTQKIMTERGIDVSSYRSNRLTSETVDKADIVLVFKVGNACPQCVLNDKDVKYA